jgi:hypothetical protein
MNDEQYAAACVAFRGAEMRFLAHEGGAVIASLPLRAPRRRGDALAFAAGGVDANGATWLEVIAANGERIASHAL